VLVLVLKTVWMLMVTLALALSTRPLQSSRRQYQTQL
jgi:hypothetical protein